MKTEIGDHPQQRVDDGWPSPISRAGSLAIGEPEALHPAPLVIGLPTRKPLPRVFDLFGRRWDTRKGDVV
jgi:hypothetical protein